jgi:stage V sporulation protein K
LQLGDHVLTPQTIDETLSLFEQGLLTPAEAFAHFRRIERKPYSTTPVRRSVEAHSKETDIEVERVRQLNQVLHELDNLIGLTEVKSLVREMQAFIDIQQRRRSQMLVTEPLVMHMIFAGNPGTGKTTVARIFGKLFREMGVLPKGHLIEAERADLVGEYIGHTALKSREILKKAMGGILFIDEAYSLARGGEKDFGKEAIDTLVKAMEDHKDEIILILAGYSREMELFLRTNPGLRSRFPIQIDFPDYTVEELMRIADMMLRQRQYKLAPSARRKLLLLLQTAIDSGLPHFSNARLVRNLIERAIRRQAVRLVDKKRVDKEDLMLLEESDIEEVSA